MKIVVISRSAEIESTRLLIEAASARGIEAEAGAPEDFKFLIGPRGEVFFKGEPLSGDEVFIPRAGPIYSPFVSELCRAAEALGYVVVNRPDAVNTCREKVRALAILTAAGIHVVESLIVRGSADLKRCVETLGEPPFIIKLPQGTHGAGVMLAESMRSAASVIDACVAEGHEVVVQRFIAESEGRDIRALVVGDEVAASMERNAAEGEFRSNLHKGGSARRVELDAATAEIAVKAARCVGLDYAGVDLILAAEGPLVTEVNASCGLEGITATTGVDVAGKIVDLAANLYEDRKKSE